VAGIELGLLDGIAGGDLLERMKLPGFTVTRVVRAQEGSRRLIKVYFEHEGLLDGEPHLEAGWLSFRADECWALDAFEIRAKGLPAALLRQLPKDQQGQRTRFGTFSYRGKQNGIPVLESVRWKHIRAGKTQYTLTLRVTDIRFGPAPDQTFDLTSFDADPPPDQGETVAPAEDIFVCLTRWLVRAIGLCSAAVVLSMVRPLVRCLVAGKKGIIAVASHWKRK
jgi:hypothetical protein